MNQTNIDQILLIKNFCRSQKKYSVFLHEIFQAAECENNDLFLLSLLNKNVLEYSFAVLQVFLFGPMCSKEK